MLRAQVEQRLLREGGIGADNVGVEADRAVVRLPGSVATLLTRHRALGLADTVAGVRGVVSLISLNVIRRPDMDIVHDVQASISDDPALNGTAIEVYSIDGAATLGGSVSSQAQSRLV